MKNCSNPNCTMDNPQSFDSFSKDKGRKDGLYPRCKACRNLFQKENSKEISKKDRARYKKNREKILAKQAIYNASHKKEKAEYMIGYYASHKEEKAKYQSEYYKKDKKNILKKNRAYRDEHIEDILAKQAVYGVKYREENREKEAARGARWRKENPDKHCATVARRRAAKLNATPTWAIKEHHKQIEAIYAEAARLTKETGIQHHVDHIIPLQNKNVSGLHVSWNLQILTDKENVKKGNRFDFTHENKSWKKK